MSTANTLDMLSLLAEFNARAAVQSLDGLKWLRAHGVDVAHTLNLAGPITDLKIHCLPQRRFEFADALDEAVRAFVHPAGADDAETTVDLVAWTREPERVMQCLGRAEGLGIDQITNPATWFMGQPLAVHPRPLDWFVAGCSGVVIFDARRVRARLEALPFRDQGYSLAAYSLAHGRSLRRAFAPLPDGIQIVVPVEDAVA